MATENTTQQFVPIADIHDDVVVLKDGQMCMVLLATSINFALKSTDEQQAILSQFQALLNALDFSVQIYVQSRRFDVRQYVEQLRDREQAQDNELMKIQLREYIDFITTFTEQVDIMTKNFFVVISYTPIKLEVKGLGNIIKSTKGGSETENDTDRFFEHRTQLEQRVSIVEQGLTRIGIRVAPLSTEQLTEMYYRIFNPEDLSAAPRQ